MAEKCVKNRNTIAPTTAIDAAVARVWTIPGLDFASVALADGATFGCGASADSGGALGLVGTAEAGTIGVSSVFGVVLSLSVRPGACAGCSMVVAADASAVGGGAGGGASA